MQDHDYYTPRPPTSPTPLYAYSPPVSHPALGLFQVSIHVITNDRLTSLTRLVNSLLVSHFLGDKVELSFHVDVDADAELMDYLMVRAGGMACRGLMDHGHRHANPEL